MKSLPYLKKLNQQGITLILVTHDKALGKRAKRQLTMVDGQIIQDIDRDKLASGSA